MKKRSLFFVFILISLHKNYAQSVFFNPNQSLIALNPSFAGSNGGIRNQSTFSNNLASFNINQRYYNSTDVYLKSIKAGFGLTAVLENFFSFQKKMQIQFTYAQHLSCMKDKLKISPSVQIEYNKTKVDYEGITFRDLIFNNKGYLTPNNYYTRAGFEYITLNGGLLINYKHFYFGTTALYVNRPTIGYYQRDRQTLSLQSKFYASYNLQVSENLLFNTLVNFGFYRGQFTKQIDIKSLLFKQFIVGIGVSYNYDYYSSATLGYRHNYFTATVCYAPPLSVLMRKYRGIVEFGLSYNLRNKELRKKVVDIERW